MKKGQIQIQMNWIFVGVAGVIILMFFFGIMMKQRTTARVVEVRDFLDTLEDYVAAVSASSQTAVNVIKQDYEIKFTAHSAQAGNQQIDFGPKVVFAPFNIEKDESDIILYSYPWMAPYKVTDFLYISSPRERYVFVWSDGDSLKDEIVDFYENILPGKEFIRKKSYTYGTGTVIINIDPAKGTRDHVVIFSDGSNTLGVGGASNDATYITVTPGFGGKIPSGNFSFKDSGALIGADYVYVGYAPLLGAIFSQDVSNYQSSMDLAMENLFAINEVLKAKEEILIEEISDYCTRLYVGGQYYTAISMLDREYTKSSAGELRRAADGLAAANNKLEAASCPLLY